MMDKQPTGIFEVTDHYEMAGRGGFVIGHLMEGAVSVGNIVLVPASSTHWTICGVESLNTADQKRRNALVFSERPTIAAVQEAFPVGFNMQELEVTTDR